MSNEPNGPPRRESQAEHDARVDAEVLAAATSTEPPEIQAPRDEPAIARTLRRIDHAVGVAEQATLFALLVVVVVTSIASELASLIAGVGFGDKGTTVIKYSVFAMAMLGGAYATHGRRLLSLDLLSRFLAARPRAVLRIALALFAIFIAGVAIWGGLSVYEVVAGEPTRFIPARVPALFVPIGFTLVAFHLVIQVVIEVEYLRHRRTAPEPEQGAA